MRLFLAVASFRVRNSFRIRKFFLSKSDKTTLQINAYSNTVSADRRIG
jgi:hypothetical protein